jgi:RNA polymerase sigma-70 factor (ECF subfamily)
MSANVRGDGAESAGEIDAELIAQTLAGHQAAYDRLVGRYHRQAVGVAYRLLGHIEDAADVAQDAFLQAYRRLDSLQDRRRFAAWLMRIVSNLSRNYRRSRKTASAVSLDDVGEIGSGGRVRESAGRTLGLNPQSAPQSAELQAAIRQAMDALPEKQRLALILFSLEGLPQKEVASILDCTVELVKWNVFQARKKLKEALADYL